MKIKYHGETIPVQAGDTVNIFDGVKCTQITLLENGDLEIISTTKEAVEKEWAEKRRKFQETLPNVIIRSAE